VDFRRPVQAVIPGAHGRILAVLAEVSTELNLRTIARLSGVSPAQASRILPTLVDLGIVERRDAAPSALFRLVEDNVAGRAVLAIARAQRGVLNDLGASAARLIPAPVSVVVFGSFARGDAGPESDLDVLMVRPSAVDPDDEAWGLGIEAWRQQARRLSGNPVEVLEAGEAEVGGLLQSGRPLWADILRDGVLLAGRPLRDMQAA
jgi:DNA-binding MarR family transcriptional regulator